MYDDNSVNVDKLATWTGTPTSMVLQGVDDMLCDLHTNISTITAFYVSMCYSCRPFIIFIKSAWKLQKTVLRHACLLRTTIKRTGGPTAVFVYKVTMINDDNEAYNLPYPLNF